MIESRLLGRIYAACEKAAPARAGEFCDEFGDDARGGEFAAACDDARHALEPHPRRTRARDGRPGRRAAPSRRGGRPNRRAYSRLNCDGLS